jgi:hypothetical protein
MTTNKKSGERTEKRTSGAAATGRKSAGGSKAARADKGAKSQARVVSIEAGGTKSGRGGNARKATAAHDRDTAARPSNTRKPSGRTTSRGKSEAA